MKTLHSFGRLGASLCVATALLSSTRCEAKTSSTSVISISARVTRFYRLYMGEFDKSKGDLASNDQTRSRAIKTYSSRRLRRWLASPTYREYGSDYFIDAQDFRNDWNQAHVSEVKVQGNSATLRVVLGSPKPTGQLGSQTLRLKMVREEGAWKIDRVNGN